MNEAIKLAIEKGGFGIDGATQKENENLAYHLNNSHDRNKLVLDPLFWTALERALGWGKSIHINGKCLHCGMDINYQPTLKSGCNHVHYPEACNVCSDKAQNWKYHALRYFELKLTGGDEEKFWSELLGERGKE